MYTYQATLGGLLCKVLYTCISLPLVGYIVQCYIHVHKAALGGLYCTVLCTYIRLPLVGYSVQCYNGTWLHRSVHGDVMAWKRFPHYWPFVRGIHWSPMDSPHTGPVTWNFDVCLRRFRDRAFSRGIREWQVSGPTPTPSPRLLPWKTAGWHHLMD